MRQEPVQQRQRLQQSQKFMENLCGPKRHIRRMSKSKHHFTDKPDVVGDGIRYPHVKISDEEAEFPLEVEYS